MSDVPAVSVSLTCAVPLTVGLPVAGLFGLGSTAAVASLVTDSGLLASSVKDTLTLMAFAFSSSVRVWVSPVAPAISVLSASHW